MEKQKVKQLNTLVSRVDGREGIWFLGEVVTTMVKQLLWKLDGNKIKVIK